MTNKYNYWFPEKRFGMFIHWGLYSITGWHEQYMGRQNIDRSEYIKLAKRFNPINFNPDKWIDIAKAAGMKYICITTKHHDGFCMWNTKYTDFNVINTPYGKDILKQLADACNRRGMGLCLYYSNPDWHHPNAYNPKSSHQLFPLKGDMPDQKKYIEFVKNQVRELCTDYGPILSFFWDIPPKIFDPSVNELLRELQPGIMINDRGYDEGDYATPERSIPNGKCFDKPTEACQSVGRQSWGYNSLSGEVIILKLKFESLDEVLKQANLLKPQEEHRF